MATIPEDEQEDNVASSMDQTAQIEHKLYITFRNVSLTLPNSRSDYDAKRILSNVTGHIGPGLCALMGPSASGRILAVHLGLPHMPLVQCCDNQEKPPY